MDTSKQMLAMKANKKLLQRGLQESIGNVLHNIAATITSAPVGGSILQTLVNDMRKEPRSLTEIVTSDQNELHAVYYQSGMMVQQHLQESTGKVAPLKDLHNIAATVTAATVDGSILQTLVNDVCKEPR